MALRAFRVTDRVQWDGWVYAPTAEQTHSADLDETWEQVLAAPGLTQKQRADAMKQRGCKDERSVDPAIYGGDIVLIEEGHPRLPTMMEMTRKFIYDGAIPPVDELLKEAKFKRLLSPPKVMAGAGR